MGIIPMKIDTTGSETPSLVKTNRLFKGPCMAPCHPLTY